MVESYIAAASRLLLNEGFGPGPILTALETIGRGLDVDRVYVFEDSTDQASGKVVTSQRFEWSAENVETQVDNPELQEIPYEFFVPEWQALLARGEPVRGLVRDMSPGPGRKLLESQNILSILVCPIHVGGKSWGFVGFDACRSERPWTASEVRSLNAIAKALGASLRHSTMKRNLEAARERLRAILDS